jgi:hypothetical protein
MNLSCIIFRSATVCIDQKAEFRTDIAAFFIGVSKNSGKIIFLSQYGHFERSPEAGVFSDYNRLY